MFVICNEEHNKFYAEDSVGKRCFTSNKDNCKKWKRKQSALNVLVDLQRCTRLKMNNWIVADITPKNTVNIVTDPLQKIVDKINTLTEFINNSDSEISDELSKIDLEISDLYHYIEFNSFNACDGFKLARHLKVLLQKRRAIKNSKALIQSIYNGISSYNDTYISDFLEKSNDKHYTNRIIDISEIL